jgi:hypothetical protein
MGAGLYRASRAQRRFRNLYLPHHPIREVCHIVNIQNKHTAIVGNCCVTKFEGDTAFKGTHKIFDALRRIRKDKEASANKALIKYAYNHDIIDEAGYRFYIDIGRKRKLSERQRSWKVSLNHKIVKQITRGRQENRVGTVAARTLPEALNVLRANPQKLADKRLVEDAHTKGILNDKDYQFYLSLWERKARNPSENQQKWLDDLNARMLRRLSYSS